MMSDLPMVSLITPVYNGAVYIEELILSVQAQNYPNLEHIIIDDGSSDNTVSILEKYSHLHWRSRANRGQYATMNEGLETAQGAIICFISADDLLAKGAVSTAVQYLLEHPDIDGVYGDYECINGSGSFIYPLRPFRRFPTYRYPYSLHISHSSFYLRKKSLFEKKLFFNEHLRYVGDYEWTIRILNTPLRINVISDSLSFIRLHENQTTNRSFFAMRAENLAVQRQLGVSPFIASAFRKILFVARMMDTFKDKGMRAMLASLSDRIWSS